MARKTITTNRRIAPRLYCLQRKINFAQLARRGDRLFLGTIRARTSSVSPRIRVEKIEVLVARAALPIGRVLAVRRVGRT
jgi:hypothetical protein